MAKTTISFGVVLILVGILGFVSAGTHSFMAMLPIIVGVILTVLGFLALTDNAKKRMLVMHIAVTVALLAFLGTIKSLADYIEMVLHGRQFHYPNVVIENAAMAAVTLLFVLLSVRSFIAARRGRA